MFEIINSIEVDIALVSGLIALLIASAVTVVGLIKTAKESKYTFRRNNDGEMFIQIGSLVTLVGLIPLTIYITTRAFPTMFQQFVVSFLTLAVFAFVPRSRYIVQFPLAIGLSFIISIVSTIVKAVYGVFKFLYEISTSSPDESPATDADG